MTALLLLASLAFASPTPAAATQDVAVVVAVPAAPVSASCVRFVGTTVDASAAVTACQNVSTATEIYALYGCLVMHTEGTDADRALTCGAKR